MISSGLPTELNAPMVYLAPDQHAFLVLGDGQEPLITWSMSFNFASEQADIHGGVVVAVPIVRDSSWRRQHPDDVAVPAASMPRREPAPAGYAVGRAAVGGGQGNPDGWSSARPDVEGQHQGTVTPLVRRSAPFGDPAAPLLPEDPEGALRDAFGGGDGPVTAEAMAAFHATAQANMATLEAIRYALSPVEVPDRG